MKKSWQIQNKELIQDLKFFEIYKYKIHHTGKKKDFDYFIMHTNNWVNVIPITQNHDVIMIRQYRAGSDEITYEFPGGVIDTTDSDPLTAGKRELQEETGFIPKETFDLGFVHPNPAIQNNRCYFCLATGCEKLADIKLDEMEDIEVELIPLSKIGEMVKSQQIKHALMIAALQKLMLLHPEFREELFK